MRPTLWSAVAVAVFAFALSPAYACPECRLEKAGLFLGEFKLLGNGTVRSWVRLDEEGKPLAIGVTMTETALEGLTQVAPENPHDEEYVLALPPEAAAVGIDHISVDWNPEGHIPPGLYDVPHFDVHFYLISPEERDQIVKDEKDLSLFQVKLAEKFIPEGYIYAPEGEEPRMGAHWVDVTSPEFNGKPFSTTFIYGSYNGRLVFIEPMMTHALLASKPNVTFPIKQPAAVQKDGYYPTEWSINYDETRKEITISLHGLKQRKAEAGEAEKARDEAGDAGQQNAAARKAGE